MNRIIIGTNNFGLGPVGKVSSIINSMKDEYEWFACGNAFDLNIFKEGIFKDTLFTKDKNLIEEFVKRYDIKFSIVVLDVELSKILMSLGVAVIFVDSLPFMWTQADIDEGLLPLDADVYCAQKCINLTENSKKVLSQINNLKWVNPIQNSSDNTYRPINDDYVLINVGGLHSPIGNGESYIETVLIPVINVFNSMNKKIVITGGTNAVNSINRLLSDKNIDMNNIIITTMKQSDFLSSVNNSELFLTSPGLTTIYETSSLKKPTILLPPQNLSQFYNIEYAKKIIDKFKYLNWDTSKLNLEYLNEILDKGETYVVEKIYEYITELVGTNYSNEFEIKIKDCLNGSYFDKIESDFIIDGNGVADIKNILEELVKEKNNE